MVEPFNHLEIVKKEKEIVLAENDSTRESGEFPRNHLQRYGLRKPTERIHSPRASEVEEALPHLDSRGKRERAISKT